MLSKFKHLVSVLLIGATLTALPSNALAKRVEPLHYIAILQENDRSKQTKQFVELSQRKLKYVSSDAYNGKKGKWIASADVYSEYNQGVFEKQILRQASLQYNARSLPADTKNATLVINNAAVTQPYEKKLVSFVFDTMDIPSPRKAQKTLDIKMSVSSGGSDIAVPLTQSYFDNKDHMSPEKVLERISFAYCDYAKKNDIPEPAQVVMRLKSYVSDTVLYERSYSYSWEVYFIEKDTLPSFSVLVRYDCETDSTLVSEREFKNYFK